MWVRALSVFGVCCFFLGLCEYDHDGSKARALEGAIGIKVIRHSEWRWVLVFVGFWRLSFV